MLKHSYSFQASCVFTLATCMAWLKFYFNSSFTALKVCKCIFTVETSSELEMKTLS